MWLRVCSLALPAVRLVISLGVLVAPSPCFATEQQPYCGVKCVYAAASHQGVEVNFVDLLQAKYIGCSRGSSLQELVVAATDHKLHTRVLSGLTIDSLRSLSYPTILHVKSDPAFSQYDHYVLILRSTDTSALVYDPTREKAEWIDLLGLTPTWGGVGILVSAKPIHAVATDLPTYLGTLLDLVPIGCMVLVITRAVKLYADARPCPQAKARSAGWIRTVSRAWCHGVILGSFVAVAAVVYHLSYPSGLLAGNVSTAAIDQVQRVRMLPTIDAGRVRHLAAERSAFVVDSRLETDYEAGHIEGAVSIPVDAAPERAATALRGVPKDRTVIVYCQSRGCPFSDIVAGRLLSLGYERVSILRGGWVEYAQSGR